MSRKGRKIGVVGQGFVGSAVKTGFSFTVTVYTYDKFLPDHSNVESIEELAEKTSVIFVCVPTPMKRSGECDTSIVREVCTQIAAAGHKNTIVIKSTVPPGTTRSLHSELHAKYGATVLFNPEFLTEANSIWDFRNQDRIIIGDETNQAAAVHVRRLYAEAFPMARIIMTSSTVAEMIKYTTNAFLAMKVSFANEMYQICQALDAPYDEVASIFKMDHRVGKSHLQVPGPCTVDGERPYGYGGHCFPKDVAALIHKATELGVKPTMLEATHSKNNEVRAPEHRDWERMVGRAVSDED